MQNDERDREPVIGQPDSDSDEAAPTPRDGEGVMPEADGASPAGDAAEDQRSVEEFETAPPGAPEPFAPSAEMAPPTALVPDEGADPIAGRPPSEAEAYPAPTAPAGAEPPAAPAHSVPATPPAGESTQCPRCGTENRPGVAFCRNCGQRLVAAGVATTVQRPSVPEGTQQCPRCGTHNRAGVAFCQNCGANLRVAAVPASGDAPLPASASTSTTDVRAVPRGGAVLGPIVLLVGAIGLATAWLLPFAYGGGSLWDRSFGASGGYGIAFWSGYAGVGGGIVDKAYFGFGAAVPILIALLAVLAVAGFLRAAPGQLQWAGIVLAVAVGPGADCVLPRRGGGRRLER